MEKKFAEKKKAIMVLGPPGSGKGTQAELLAEKLGFFHFITSQVGKDYIRTHKDPETQRQMKIYKKGVLFEPPWLLKVVKEKTQEIAGRGKGIVYDGSPRTLYEAKGLYLFLVDIFGKENVMTLDIIVRDRELKNRLSKRLICDKDSNHVFISSDLLISGGSCPENDGGILNKRDLDDPKIFKTRMVEYRNRTIPGLKYLKKKRCVIVINGEQAIEDVFKEILIKIK